MAGGTRQGRIDQARGKIRELEGRLLKLEGQLKVLQGQTRQARGQARVRLARLEKTAASQVARVQAALGLSTERITDVLHTGRRRVEKLMRSVEPTLQKSLAQGRDLARASAVEARLLSRGLRAGVKAGREAFRRSRRA